MLFIFALVMHSAWAQTDGYNPPNPADPGTTYDPANPADPGENYNPESPADPNDWGAELQPDTVPVVTPDTVPVVTPDTLPNVAVLTLPFVDSRQDSIQLGKLDQLLVLTLTDPASVLEEYVFKDCNPNLIVYAPEGCTVERSHNVVIGDSCQSLVLTDGYPVNIPSPFLAKMASYTRRFSKETVMGKSAGWETLALPFDVQDITTQDGRHIAPFGQTGTDNFWLGTVGEGGFEPADAILANVPYIIAMPNNSVYTSGNITGPVTFEATDVVVATTDDALPVEGAYIFTPVYEGIASNEGIYAINEEDYEGYHPGGAFVRGLRDVRPFEAYLTLSAGAKQRNVIPIFESETTGMYNLPCTMYNLPGGEEYFDLSGRRISKPTKAGVYLLKQGKTVQKVQVK